MWAALLCLTTARGQSESAGRKEGEGKRAKRNIENENKENYELCQARTTGGQGWAGQARSGQASFAKLLLKVIGKAVH